MIGHIGFSVNGGAKRMQGGARRLLSSGTQNNRTRYNCAAMSGFRVEVVRDDTDHEGMIDRQRRRCL
jgi:hypothetical protein